MEGQLKGQCLCGEVKFTAEPADGKMGICHCGMCRRWTGGSFMATDCGESVIFEDEAALGRYRGSAWAERLFCTKCGSTLLWQTQDGKNQHVSIQAFVNPEDFEFSSQIFIDRKPANYAYANKTKTMTEAEVMAMFGGQ